MDYLPRDAWVVWQDPLEIAEVGRSFVARLASPVGVYAFEAVVQQARRFRRLDLSSFTSSGTSDAFVLRTEAPPPFSGKAETVREELAEAAADGPVLLFSDNDGERQRLDEILSALPAEAARPHPPGRRAAGARGSGWRPRACWSWRTTRSSTGTTTGGACGSASRRGPSTRGWT